MLCLEQFLSPLLIQRDSSRMERSTLALIIGELLSSADDMAPTHPCLSGTETPMSLDTVAPPPSSKPVTELFRNLWGSSKQTVREMVTGTHMHKANTEVLHTHTHTLLHIGVFQKHPLISGDLMQHFWKVSGSHKVQFWRTPLPVLEPSC